ncbi:hypothetical protein MBLNU459_g6796t1 [Dothideomycetes sp. NU459]
MAANGIKTEDGVVVKPDPASLASPALHHHDDDDYEDTGELQIPAQNGAWLAKLPKWLWEAWSTLEDDQEIEIGKMRIYDKRDDDIAKNKIRLQLHDIPQHAKVPKKYDINVAKATYNNTVVFSERDQPGHRAWRPNRVIKRDRDFSNHDYKVNKKKYTSSIPKQTALAAKIENEVTVTAVENDEYRRLTDARFTQMFQPKRTTTFATGVDSQMHPSMVTNNNFSAFVSASKPKTNKKKQQEKAVRISQEDLLDALHDCFREFRYWSLRALKQKLHQPEAYIKTVVEKIATLIRSGPFAMQYKLNPEYESSLNVDTSRVKEEAAAEGESDDDMKDDDDGDEDDFEDVKMDEA